MIEAPPREPSSQSEATEEEIAASIALILAGGIDLPSGATPLSAIAALLLLLPGFSQTSEDASVANAVARLVVDDAKPLPKLTETNTALRRAHIDNLVYRAHYAINATKRVAASVVEGEDLRGALRGEGRFLHQHLEANRVRAAGAKLNDAAAERWGPVLGWNHTGKAHTHRPNHVAADGANYRVDSPPVSTDGMLPGMALHCDCIAGPPHPGGRMLV